MITTTATTTHLTPLYALHGPSSQAFVAAVAAWLVTHDSITRDRVAQIAAEAEVVVMSGPELAAKIEALADEWEAEGRSALGPLGFPVQHWRDWPRVEALRGLLDGERD
jgi:hypothetical protein